MKKKDLKKQYNLVCNEYVAMFCKKQNLSFDGWVAGEVGGVAEFISQYYFSLHDIVWDINSNQPKGLILSWQDECVDNPNLSINYYAYSKAVQA